MDKWKEINFSYSLYLPFLFLFIGGIFFILNVGFDFDGYMNLQVPQSLLKNKIYGTFYDGLSPFDPRIQTGPTVLFPIALAFKIFGISLPSAGMVFEMYFLASIICLTIIVIKAEGQICGFIGLVGLIFTPYLFRWGLGGYGEFPTLFFLLLSILLLEKGFSEKFRYLFLFLSGIAAGLSLLTKVVALLPIFGLFIFVIVRSIIEKDFKKFCIWLVGFFIPQILWEIYKFVSLYEFYSSPEPYFEWWKIMIKGIFLKGRGETGTFFFFIHRLSRNLGELSKSLNTPKSFLIFSIFLSISYYLIELIKRLKHPFMEGKSILKFSLFVITFPHLIWWLFVSPDPWYRRVIIPIVLWKMAILSSMCFFLIRKIFIKDFIIKKCLSIVVLIICVRSMVTPDIKWIRWVISPTPKLTAQKKIAKVIKELPKDAVILTYGWWQCPDISFLSERAFKDMTRPGVHREIEKRLAYVLIGEEQKFLERISYWRIMNSTIGEKVAEEGNYTLYEYTFGNYFPTQLDFVLKNAPIEKWTSKLNFIEDNYDETQLGMGVRGRMSNGRWIGEGTIFWLKYKGEKRLLIKWWVPRELVLKEPLIINIFANDVFLKSIPVEQGGNFSIFLEFPPAFSTPVLRFFIKVNKFKIHKKFKYYGPQAETSISLEEIILIE